MMLSTVIALIFIPTTMDHGSFFFTVSPPFAIVCVIYDGHSDWTELKYCENGYTTKINLYIQCYLHQNFMTFFTELETGPTVHMEEKKPGKRAVWEVLQCLTSDYTTRVKVLKQNGTNIKPDMKANGAE
jgi:hypothetical protein